jgi:ankyrin repeat protein
MTALLHPGEATALRAPSADGASSDGSVAPSYGFSVDDRDEEGNTPLHLAAHSNQACVALGMRRNKMTTRVWGR